MTIDQFKAWLDGYTAAGGNDIALVKQKAAEISGLGISLGVGAYKPAYDPYQTTVTPFVHRLGENICRSVVSAEGAQSWN